MNSKIKQLRKASKQKIRINPVVIIIQRQQLTDDGFGGQIEDPLGTTDTLDPITVRLSHEKSGPEKMKETSAGLSTNLQRFLFADYQADIQQGDIFEAEGRRWKIGPVDPMTQYGKTIEYQATITDAATVEEVD